MSGNDGDIEKKYRALLSSSDPRIMTFTEGQFVFKKGESACDGCWFLIQGKIAMLDANGKKISELSGFNLFGERAFILERPHSCSAQAIETARVAFISKEEFPEMVAKKPKILDMLLKKWFGRLQQALDAIHNLSAKTNKLTEENKALVAKREDLLKAIRTLQADLDAKDEQAKVFREKLSAAVNWLRDVAQEIPYTQRGEKLSQAVLNLVKLIETQ